MKIIMPPYTEECINLLQLEGYEAYIVGGCVRDCLLGRRPNDWDICTSALPQEIKNIFKDYKTVDVGIEHGTVAVIMESNKVEITTYRIDGEYSDNRRPDKVEFTSNIKEDLKRRDFTINAMAYNNKTGIIDYFGGKEDLVQKKIKCVGNPRERFQEDALRILRGIRFSSQLNYEIQEETLTAMEEFKHLIGKISVERIREEFNKLLLGENPAIGMKLIFKMNLFAEIFEDDFRVTLQETNLKKTEEYYKHIGSYSKNLVIKLAVTITYIYTSILKNNQSSINLWEYIGKNLKYDNCTYKRVEELLLYYDEKIDREKVSIKQLMSKMTTEGFRDLIEIKCNNEHRKVSEIIALVEEIENNHEPYKLKDLAIKGNSLINLGIPKGPGIGELLAELLNLVILDPLKNEEKILLKEALIIYKKI